jgi:protein involved in polysaccharide export with SLBB domain
MASASVAGQSTEQKLPQLDDGREFRLAAGDVIQITFFYNPELEDVVQLRPDGMISMPLIGELSLDGLTITEAREKIEGLYAGTVRQPEVTIQVREYASQKIYVGGEVLRPGVVSLRGELTVLDAIMEAGGHKRTGSNKTLILIRKGEDGQPIRQKLYLHGTDTEPAAASMPLHPFDVVLIPESRIARMDRWVDQYVRQLVPITLTAGFTYLTSASTVVIP